MNDENLIPFDQLSEKEQREIRSKGGIRSGEVRRAKKTMREMLDYLLEKEIKNARGDKATTLEAMMTACVNKAIKGDIKANEFIRDTIGQKVADKIDLSGQVQKVFVTPQEQKEVNKHIDDFIE